MTAVLRALLGVRCHRSRAVSVGSWACQQGGRVYSTNGPAAAAAESLPPPLPLEESKDWPMVSPQVFALVEMAGRQWKVRVGDEIVSEKIEAGVGETVRLEDVVLLGSPSYTVIGRPVIAGAHVDAVVEEQFKDGKINIITRRPGKYRKKQGHRQPMTRLRIEKISTPTE